MALQRPGTGQRRRRHVVLMGRFAVLPAVAALGCALLPGTAAASLRTVPASFVAAVYRNSAPQGLAVFSSSSGRLVRWLLHSTSGPAPAAVSADGRWVYYYNQSGLKSCPSDGLILPALWRVKAGGGPPQKTGLRTDSFALSPDGKMSAYLSARHCGRTLWLMVRNRRTGHTRRIFLWHNAPTAFYQVATAQLSWAPDDVHLAVGLATAPAINGLSVINTRRVTNASTAPEIRPCNGGSSSVQVGCVDPGFDVHGRLTFVKWRSPVSGAPSVLALRWYHDQTTRLFRFNRTQSKALNGQSLSVNRQGTAILLESYLTEPTIWRWARSSMALVFRSTPQRTLFGPMWLQRP
jgi:hypothetical protein